MLFFYTDQTDTHGYTEQNTGGNDGIGKGFKWIWWNEEFQKINLFSCLHQAGAEKRGSLHARKCQGHYKDDGQSNTPEQEQQ